MEMRKVSRNTRSSCLFFPNNRYSLAPDIDLKKEQSHVRVGKNLNVLNFRISQ